MANKTGITYDFESMTDVINIPMANLKFEESISRLFQQ